MPKLYLAAYKGVARTGWTPASMSLKYVSHLQNARVVLFCKHTSREGIRPYPESRHFLEGRKAKNRKPMDLPLE